MFEDYISQLQASGAIGVIPTDTVYGLIARAEDQTAVARLYQAKHREGKPGTVIAANLEQLEALGLKRRYLKAVEQFWPGAVSVIIPAINPELKYLHQGKLSLAVRVPDDADLQKLLLQTGPLLTSSANQPGDPTAVTIDRARACFGDQVDFYVDGGDLSARGPSTIIRVIDDAIEVLRQGSTKIQTD